MTVADGWRRRKRRMAWLVAVGTLALAFVTAWFFTLPSWRKIAARNWPSTAAHVEETSRGPTDGREWIVAGSRVKIRFSYTASDGVTREARQDVSTGWAREHAIGEYGFLMPLDIMSSDRPWDRIRCFYDPAAPDHVVLERSLGHADVPALGPLLVLLFGGLMFVAERRNAARADDLATRVASRNGQRWRVTIGQGALAAATVPDVTPDAMLFTAIINWPAVAVTVRPHPVTLGDALDVGLSFAGRHWRRRLRVRLMLGPFGGAARWSADVFDGAIAPGESIRRTVSLPRAGDLPPGVDDCWLKITACTLIGLPWSRTLWIALDEHR